MTFDAAAFRRDLQAHPETGADTPRTAAAVADVLEDAGIAVTRGVGGHGVVASLGDGPDADAVLLRADMDALPIAEATELPYWSDFDRNLAIGDPGDAARAAHAALHEATDRALNAIWPGARACDVWQAIANALPDDVSGIGRFGHGVGLDYTEPPSIHPDDPTPFAPGMVLALSRASPSCPRMGRGPSWSMRSCWS